MGTLCPNWNPYQKFTWTKEENNAWVKRFGICAFYNGRLWWLQSKKIPNTSYLLIWFEEKD